MRDVKFEEKQKRFEFERRNKVDVKKVKRDLGLISPTYLRAYFMRLVPKSIRVSQVVSIFFHFWDLRT